MKFIGFVLALILFVAVLSGIGYGLMESWTFLRSQWSLLDSNWKPLVILISSVILFCALLAITLVRSGFRKNLLSSTGKTLAYNKYMNWYMDADRCKYADINLDAIHNMRAEFLLWAENNVLKQFNNLLSELVKESGDSESIRKYAGFVYIEIQRELGRRGRPRARQI